jgi:glutathione S-transferase
MNHDITLYAIPASLYSGKARSYLIKQGADLKEVAPAAKRFKEVVQPALSRWIIPAIETADHDIIQDGVGIIDWFEKNRKPRHPAYPDTAKQLIVSLIMDIFGGEGLLRPAMHYRWNFDEANLDFILNQFITNAPVTLPHEERLAIAEHASHRMRKAAKLFGVNEQTIPAIEASYLATMDELNAHFANHPYLLGGRPTIGDYGLFASLWAHLGRDPYPANLMKQKAPYLYRWTERMNRPDADCGEFLDYPEALLSDDTIPDTLGVLLRRVAQDYLPEIKAMVGMINDWVSTHKPAHGESVGGQSLSRGIGVCDFDWSGQTVTAGVFPYRIFMLQRIQDAFDQLDDTQQADVTQLLHAAGLSEILTTRCIRRVIREENLEKWGAENPTA